MKQVNTLLYCLGEEADAVLASTHATEEERKSYDSVLGKFDSFFKVRKNVIFERARFNHRNQLDSESAEQYIMELYTLAENCDFNELKEDMIRDRLVVGIKDSALSERLQLDSNLTLETAKKAIRQREAVQEQQLQLKGVGQGMPPVLEELKTGGREHSKGNVKRHNTTRARYSSQPRQYCKRCGKGQHPKEKCPARDASCHRCHRKGHYSSQCLSKLISELEGSLDTAFLNSLSDQTETSWQVKIALEGKEMTFKLDTGAEVTAISDSTFHHHLKHQELTKPTKILFGPSRRPLQVLGQFEGKLKHKNTTAIQRIYVVKGLKTDLLGLPAITALNLAVRVDTNTTEEEADIIKRKFPKLFTGLGNLGEEYNIKVQPQAKPHAIFSPRHVPLTLRKKVQQELHRMEEMGVISKVDQPTEWCAGMVVVPKSNGSIRICVDLKPLNECVRREVHPLPRVDETLAQLTGAKVFSKLDANSGFWQIPLSPQSRLLTTFITPFGRFCFNKLPFGICSAPEHFQKRMSAILAGLEGVLCLMDDVLIFGSNKGEHDSRLKVVLERIQKAGVTLNSLKCEFGKSNLIFLGHLIDSSGIQADPQKTSAITDIPPPNNVTELRRFMGMANQLGKFSNKLAELTQPLRELLSKKNQWLWGPAQGQAPLTR